MALSPNHLQMETTKTAYFNSREKWRDWLKENFQTEKEIWLIYPNKSTGKQRILYNDAVEEALCFGWIDSTMKKYDATHSMQRFTPRNPKSAYSQPNKERLKWLAENKMLHPEISQKRSTCFNRRVCLSNRYNHSIASRRGNVAKFSGFLRILQTHSRGVYSGRALSSR